jgi:hypothetical protein
VASAQFHLCAIGEIAGLERLENSAQILTKESLLPFDCREAPAAEIVHPGLQLSEPGQRIDTLLHPWNSRRGL